MSKDGVIVSIAEGFTAHVNTGDHQFFSDEPVSLGGSNKGPNPYDYLLAALGSCTAITLRMYANNKKWPLERAEVTLKHSRSYADDCMNCGQNSAFLDIIDTSIKLYGPLSEEQVERLRSVATKCPVHKTLSNSISIRTEVTH